MASFLTIVFAICLINGSLIGFSEQVRGKPASNGNLPYDDFLFPLVYIRFFSDANKFVSLVFEGDMTKAVVRLVIKSVFLLYFFVFDAQNALYLLTSFKTAHSKEMVMSMHQLVMVTMTFILTVRLVLAIAFHSDAI